MKYVLHLGDCLEYMRAMEAGSIDAIVTDPPYGLEFMGKEWDHGIPGVHFWDAALRVAKPGAYLLAFGGTRTHHRLMCAIEDAGWEIRDCIMWVYGSGFPKSHDVSKAIDREAGVLKTQARGFNTAGGKENFKAQDLSFRSDYGYQYTPATDAAKQWNGWGTALKPAWEPIIVARKPLECTVAENVLEYGTGALNIDASRVDGIPRLTGTRAEGEEIKAQPSSYIGSGTWNLQTGYDQRMANSGLGRWPANLIHDGSDEVLALFPQTTSARSNRGNLPDIRGGNLMTSNGKRIEGSDYMRGHNDSGSAARFFYCAKASKQDRDEGCEGMELQDKKTRGSFGDQSLYDCPDGAHRVGDKGTSKARNNHPTVKPTALMHYLCKLVTPPGGTVFDPFMGSGSTGKAAVLEGFDFIGCDIEADYVKIAEKRIAQAAAQPKQEGMFA